MNKARAFVHRLRRIPVDGRRALAAVRWLAAAGVGAWTVRQAFLVGREEVDKAFAVLHSFDAFAGLLVTVLLVSPEVAGWALSPINRLIDAVLLPSETGLPPADYTLARMYRQRMRYDEACDEYLKIIRYHPQELRAYLEGMNTAGASRQIELAAKFYRLGQREFRRIETRRLLQHTLEESCASALLAEAAIDAPETDEAAPPETRDI